jgi:AcrR family transcriptional regulator
VDEQRNSDAVEVQALRVVDQDGAPTGGRRRQGPRKGDLKEAAILEAAWRLLAEKSLASITINELAAAAGISRSTFYFYFNSRDAVIRALAQRTSEQLRNATVTALDSDRAPRDVIRSVIANLLARWRAHGPLLRSMDTLAEEDEELRSFWSSISSDIMDSFARAIDEERAHGRAPQGPPASKDLVWALTHLYWRAGQQSMTDDPREDDRLVDTLTAISVRAIYSDL